MLFLLQKSFRDSYISDIGDKSVLSDALSDASVLEEVLRMILEIVNSCLVAQIKNNPNLVIIQY